MNNKTTPFERSIAEVSRGYCRQVRTAVTSLTQRLAAQYEQIAPGLTDPIRQALKEAEALAWQTPFPHLFLPDLAELQLAPVLAAQQSSFARAV